MLLDQLCHHFVLSLGGVPAKPLHESLEKLDSNFLPPHSWPYTGTQPFDLALTVADWEDVAHHKDVVRLEDVAYRKDIGHQEDVVLRQEDAIIYSLYPFPDNQTPFHTLEGLRQFQSFSGTYASSPSSKY